MPAFPSMTIAEYCAVLASPNNMTHNALFAQGLIGSSI